MPGIKGFTIASVNSGFQKTGKSFEQIVKICLDSGFAGMEGCYAMFEKLKEKELEDAGALFKKAGLVIETYHLPFADPVKDDISALYETDRKNVEYKMKREIDRAVLLGSSIGILHPTTKNDCLTDEEGFPRLMKQLGKTLEALLRHCELYGFKLAVENMLPGMGDRLGSNINHLKEIQRRHDHPQLGFCLDTGHALISHHEKAMDVFHFMKKKLIAFHLADNAGDRDSHLAPGHGRFFWKEFFREVKKLDYKGTMCVETPPFSYGPDYTVEAWKKMHDEVSALMNKA